MTKKQAYGFYASKNWGCKINSGMMPKYSEFEGFKFLFCIKLL